MTALELPGRGYRAAPIHVKISFGVDARVHHTLQKRAAEEGRSVSDYARLLFEAAYAARVFRQRGETPADRELDLEVIAVFALADCETEYVAQATGLSQATVERIREGFAIVARELRAGRRRPSPPTWKHRPANAPPAGSAGGQRPTRRPCVRCGPQAPWPRRSARCSAAGTRPCSNGSRPIAIFVPGAGSAGCR